MTEEWKNLLALVARNGAINAEQAMGAAGSQADTETLSAARDNFLALVDKIENNEKLEGKDFVNLWAGALVSCELLKKNIKTWQAVVSTYQNTLIPKLYEIAGNPEKQQQLFEDFFSKNI